MPRAFRYVRDHEITTESAYPYTAVGGSCKTKSGEFKIKSFVNVPKTDSDLATAVT